MRHLVNDDELVQGRQRAIKHWHQAFECARGNLVDDQISASARALSRCGQAFVRKPFSFEGNPMNKLLLAGLASALVALPAAAALKMGDKAPTFSAQASLAGKAFSFSLADALKKGPVVVYFYPSAFTQGCNLQAHTFSENMDKFTAAGASVIGVSLDSIQRLNDFSADPNYCAGKVAVASDPSGSIAKSFDVMVGGSH